MKQGFSVNGCSSTAIMDQMRTAFLALIKELMEELERQEFLETTKAFPDLEKLIRINRVLRGLFRLLSTKIMIEGNWAIKVTISKFLPLLGLVKSSDKSDREFALLLIQWEINYLTTPD